MNDDKDVMEFAEFTEETWNEIPPSSKDYFRKKYAEYQSYLNPEE